MTDECPTCGHVKSPLEDPEFTALYKEHEPHGWINQQIGVSGGQPHIILQLPELFEVAFERSGNNAELTKLGRTLVAMGYTRTYRSGTLSFVKEIK